MRIKIDQMLESQDKTRYWLAKEVGISYAAMAKLCGGETESVKFRTLDSICKLLNCKIQDILEESAE